MSALIGRRKVPRAGGRYRFLEHTADVGIVATGQTREEAFASAAEGLFAFIGDLGQVQEREVRTIQVSAPDEGALLVRFLNEANFIFETQHFLFKRFEVLELVPNKRLVARGYGEPVDLARHGLKSLVKAATYHLLEVKRYRGRWRVQVILDI